MAPLRFLLVLVVHDKGIDSLRVFLRLFILNCGLRIFSFLWALAFHFWNNAVVMLQSINSQQKVRGSIWNLSSVFSPTATAPSIISRRSWETVPSIATEKTIRKCDKSAGGIRGAMRPTDTSAKRMRMAAAVRRLNLRKHAYYVVSFVSGRQSVGRKRLCHRSTNFYVYFGDFSLHSACALSCLLEYLKLKYSFNTRLLWILQSDRCWERISQLWQFVRTESWEPTPIIPNSYAILSFIHKWFKTCLWICSEKETSKWFINFAISTLRWCFMWTISTFGRV